MFGHLHHIDGTGRRAFVGPSGSVTGPRRTLALVVVLLRVFTTAVDVTISNAAPPFTATGSAEPPEPAEPPPPAR